MLTHRFRSAAVTVGALIILGAGHPGLAHAENTRAQASAQPNGFVSASLLWKGASDSDSDSTKIQEVSHSVPGAAPRPSWTPEERWSYTRAFLPECNGQSESAAEWCAWEGPEAGEEAKPPQAGVEALAREVVASLQLPEGTPQIGPDPSWNEWGMAVVGHPLWLWVDGPSRLVSTNTAYGMTVSLEALRGGTSFTFGDGTQLWCEQTAVYQRGAVEPGTPSPVCGHTYTHAPAKVAGKPGTDTITAATSWNVNWSASGYSGTLTTTRTANRDVPVGELQAILVHR